MIPIVLPDERLARNAKVLTTLPRHSGKLKDRKKKVRYVQDVDEEKDECTFIVKSASQHGKAEVTIYFYDCLLFRLNIKKIPFHLNLRTSACLDFRSDILVLLRMLLLCTCRYFIVEFYLPGKEGM